MLSFKVSATILTICILALASPLVATATAVNAGVLTDFERQGYRELQVPVSAEEYASIYHLCDKFWAEYSTSTLWRTRIQRLLADYQQRGRPPYHRDKLSFNHYQNAQGELLDTMFFTAEFLDFIKQHHTELLLANANFRELVNKLEKLYRSVHQVLQAEVKSMLQTEPTLETIFFHDDARLCLVIKLIRITMFTEPHSDGTPMSLLLHNDEAPENEGLRLARGGKPRAKLEYFKVARHLGEPSAILIPGYVLEHIPKLNIKASFHYVEKPHALRHAIVVFVRAPQTSYPYRAEAFKAQP